MGATIGKHLNVIDGGNKLERVSGERFEELWNEQVTPLLPNWNVTEDEQKVLNSIETD